MNSSDLEAFVPIQNRLPEEWEEARNVLTEALRETAEGVNVRDYAYYIDIEAPNGQTWFPDAGEFRSGFRKVIDVSPLPNFGVTNPYSVPHGITTTANTKITRLYGAATDPGATTLTSGIPLPFVDTTAGANPIRIEIDATNVVLSGSGDYSNYTTAYIVVEWLDEE